MANKCDWCGRQYSGNPIKASDGIFSSAKCFCSEKCKAAWKKSKGK